MYLRRYRSRPASPGFTLLETLIAMGAGLAVAGIIVSMGVSAKQSSSNETINFVISEIKSQMREMYAGRVNIRYDAPIAKVAERSSSLGRYWDATSSSFIVNGIGITVAASNVVMLGQDGVKLTGGPATSFKVTTTALPEGACQHILLAQVADAAAARVSNSTLSAGTDVNTGAAANTAAMVAACGAYNPPRISVDFN